MSILQRILIVEDDAIIGMLLEEYVLMMGREPVAVVDGVEPALARISQGGIDAAIVDVHLADGDSGDPIALALADANIPFLVATGGFTAALGTVWRNRPVLEKPFTLESLRGALGALD
ncbi:response regulator [Sphingopyxis panaciterrae]